MGAQSRKARAARRAAASASRSPGEAYGQAQGTGSDARDRAAGVPLTREEVLASLAWTAPLPGPAMQTDQVEKPTFGTAGDEPATGDDGRVERVACPPVTAGLMADEILASLDPRRFRDALVELAVALQPTTCLEWSDLLELVRNQLNGHDIAVARSRLLVQARVSQRAELLKSQALTNGQHLDGRAAESVARRSLQGDTRAEQTVAEVARQQGLTLADCDARALQQRLDSVMKLDALGEGAQRRYGRVRDRIERRITAERLAAGEVARHAALARLAERDDRRKEERDRFKREQQEELRRQWQRQAQAQEEDRAFVREKRQRLRRRWEREEGIAPVDGLAPVPDTTTVEVLGPGVPAASGDTAGGLGGG